MADHPHAGHRKRTMAKFRQFGMDIFADHEALEILLYFAVRQGDTNPTAHRLLDRFGMRYLRRRPSSCRRLRGLVRIQRI